MPAGVYSEKDLQKALTAIDTGWHVHRGCIYQKMKWLQLWQGCREACQDRPATALPWFMSAPQNFRRQHQPESLPADFALWYHQVNVCSVMITGHTNA